MTSKSGKTQKCCPDYEDPFSKFAFVQCCNVEEKKEEKKYGDKDIIIPVGTKKTYTFETKEFLYELVYPNFAPEFGPTNSLYTGIIITNKTDHKIFDDLSISDFSDPTDSGLTYQFQTISSLYYIPPLDRKTGFSAVLTIGKGERNSLIIGVNPSSPMKINLDVSLKGGIFTVKFIDVTNPSSPNTIGTMVFEPTSM